MEKFQFWKSNLDPKRKSLKLLKELKRVKEMRWTDAHIHIQTLHLVVVS